MASWLHVVFAASTLVACVGDDVEGKDATADVASSDSAAETASDASSDASADVFEAGEAGCGTPPFGKVNANCTQVSCVRATKITCEANNSACTTSGGRVLDCGATSDCDGSACCLAPQFNVKPGCPYDAVISTIQNTAAACTTNTTKACATGQVQVCVTNADCVTGTCQDTVFDINSTMGVHFGTCQ